MTATRIDGNALARRIRADVAQRSAAVVAGLTDAEGEPIDGSADEAAAVAGAGRGITQCCRVTGTGFISNRNFELHETERPALPASVDEDAA